MFRVSIKIIELITLEPSTQSRTLLLTALRINDIKFARATVTAKGSLLKKKMFKYLTCCGTFRCEIVR